MELSALKIFLTVAHERSFSRAAAKVHRTQPAVSQAIRRLELELGEQLFDRSSKTGTLTEAGRMLQNYGQRLVRLAEETESAVRDLRDLRRGRVLVGANEAAVHTLLPVIARFRQRYPDIAIDVRRVPARQIAVEVQQGSLDFGALTFHPPEVGLLEVPVGSDELVLLGARRRTSWPPDARWRWRTSRPKRSSPTTIRRPRASGCCGCSRIATFRCGW
jgi:DNA-binding transcriptional LysR family regulator